MTSSKFPGEKHHHRVGRNIYRYMISAVLAIVAIVGGIFVLFSLDSGQQETTTNQGGIISGAENHESTDGLGQQTRDSQSEDKTLAESVLLVNTYDELNINILEGDNNL